MRYLLTRLDPEIVVGLISNTPRGTDGLLAWVMIGSGTNLSRAPIQTFFESSSSFSMTSTEKGRRSVILIVDEAQNLGLETLEELRMLSNINADKDQFLQIILVGQPQLKDMLRTPQLVQFAQRVSSDFHLRPLSPQEVTQYIDYRLSSVGARQRLFSPEATMAIARASRGIPRTINILCDTALVYGFATSAPQITEDIVTSVIDDKNQFGVLPLSVSAG